MVTFVIIIALLSLAALVGMVVAVGDKTPVVAAAETTAGAASAAPGGWVTLHTLTTPVWEAVRAQVLTALQPEAIASRALAKAKHQRKAAKRHRRWVRRATAAEARAKALAEAKTTRLEARRAAKAEARAKSAAVAHRYGHAAARGAAAVKAHRRLVVAGLATPVTLVAGIKAQKRATRGSTSAQLAAKRQIRLTAAQQRNAADRVAADAANAAFAAEQAVKATAKAARDAWADLRREAMGTQQHYIWTAAGAKAELAAAKAAAREAREAELAGVKALASVTWEQTQEARRVLWLGRKALAKAELIAWLEAGNGQVSKAAETRLAELVRDVEEARDAFWADTGVSPEVAAAREAIRAAHRQVAA